MTSSRKTGSALLIVLGFLSFMVVSAVAFAIYMRAERLPSSALRRNVATRHLVHAALAEAISRVDDAVRGDPFPGLCQTNTDYAAQGSFTYRDQQGQAMDVWQGRVFMPPDPLGGTTSKETRFAPVTETVSVLTLEGLGYLPPALVNDVRFLSRSSWAAQWQQLPFDAGRFAYCAVNVSDYFDINRLHANRGRTSEASGRISLGYLFDSSFDPTAPVGGNVGDVVNFSTDATKFDQFVHTSRPGGDDKSEDNTLAAGNTVPYVSMLDYNLALGASGGSSSLMPLFHDWIAGSQNLVTYYQDGSQQAKSAARQPFITESASSNETWRVDIAKAADQPFPSLNMANKNGVSEVIRGKSRFISEAASAKLLSLMDSVLLYDYLDHDDVPFSLACPCVERVPMIAALEPVVKFAPGAIVAGTSTTTKEGDVQKTSTPFEADPTTWFPGGGGKVNAVVAFPFKHGAGRKKGRFRAQAFVRLFLAPAGLNSRPNPTFASELRPKESDWEQDQPAFSFKGENNVFMLTARSRPVQMELPDDDLQEESEAYCEGGGNTSVLIDVPLSDRIEGGKRPFVTRITKKKIDPETGGDIPGAKEEETWTINVRPFIDLNGTPANGAAEISVEDFNNVAELNLVPYVCVWVRIVNEDNDTVDLVPAFFEDDDLNDGRREDPILRTFASDNAPLMRFIGEKGMSYRDISSGAFTGGECEWSPRAMYSVDPRFNWAPEAWYEVNKTGVTFDMWLKDTKNAVGMGTSETRDEDIFMFTSNQGILQSLGEFAFLPCLMENGAELCGDPHLDGRSCKEAADTSFFACAWRTYRISKEWYDAWAAAGIGRSIDKECLVNPYTDSRAVMMAALANTPVDYWAAARGMASDCALRKDGAKLINTHDPWYDKASDSLKHAFCSKSEDSGDQLATQDLMRFCERIMAVMRARTLELINEKASRDTNWSPSDAWKEVWDDLAWDVSQNNDSVTKFLGIDQDMKNGVAFHSVDRKFLYSYWRDCFANNQQLFLIFVRAESNALGGPGEGTPAQQGGRAVALVWRNPSATRQQGRVHDAQNTYNTNGEREPHQTRVLFYHQFD